MLYLVTGGMGAGKTLFTLKWVRALQEQTNRPVCHNSVLKLKGDALTWGWKEVDFEKWQDQPDGTIFLIDECHEVIPQRGAGAKAPPDHIRAIARHRHRGFDFYLITQHPKNMDSFVRRLIADPGWHRHIKRRRGAEFASVLEWPNVNEKCESNTAGKMATVSSERYPKEVYDWYESASLHTAKFRFPKQLYYVIAALILVPLLIFAAVYFLKDFKPSQMASGSSASTSPAKLVLGPEMPAQGQEARPMSAQEYVQQYIPRVPSMAHTAPRYDGLTQPKQVPYPAACVQRRGNKECKCYTQNATPLDVSQGMCERIVKEGIFLDWQEPTTGQGGSLFEAREPALPQTLPVERTQHAEPYMGYAERLAARNSGVASILAR